jgi:hypothetical protein
MNANDQKRQQSSRTDQADGQGEGRRDPFSASTPQPKDTPHKRTPASPAEETQEERSDLADVGEADEQDGAVEGTKQGAPHQDPPATLPQEQRHERRNNM